MVARAQPHQRHASRRGIALALVVAVAGAGAAWAAPAARAQSDEPATEQYSDPFAKLGTGRQAPDWNPYSRDFGAPIPERVRRRLERVEDGPALQMLLAQVETERARTGGAAPASPARRRATPGAGAQESAPPRSSAPAQRARPRVVTEEDEEPGIVAATVSSVFARGGPEGLLLTVALVAIAVGGVGVARTLRGRQRAG